MNQKDGFGFKIDYLNVSNVTKDTNRKEFVNKPLICI